METGRRLKSKNKKGKGAVRKQPLKLKIGTLVIFKERAGVISEGTCWVAFRKGGYMYATNTLLGMIWELVFYWDDEGNLIG